MHYNVDYTDHPNKAKAAVSDILDFLGTERFEKLVPEMAKITHCGNFAMYCALAGIEGYPVIAWYESFHGEGTWKPEQLEYLK